MGWEQGFLGYPSTDETTAPDGRGRYNHFTGGVIYWHPSTDAHVVDGAILGKWASMGWERSLLGYPTTDELKIADGRGRLKPLPIRQHLLVARNRRLCSIYIS